MKATTISLLTALMIGVYAWTANADVINGTEANLPSSESVAQLYAGKTWSWKTGAGYFDPNGAFKCVLREVGHIDTCSGSWSTRGGILTIIMNWKSTPPRSFMTAWRSSKIFFSHEEQAGNILQKKEPNGVWFVFKHATPEKGDEWAKLQPGDQTAEVLNWKL